MKQLSAICLAAALSLLAGCATTEYKSFESKNNLFEGTGGTKIVVDGMDIWDNGEPPRTFKVLGIIDDERPGGIIPMASLRGDMAKKAREAGGDAVIQLSSESRISGYYSSGTATARTTGNVTAGYGPTATYKSSTTAYGTSTTVPMKKNAAKFAVIKYLD